MQASEGGSIYEFKILGNLRVLIPHQAAEGGRCRCHSGSDEFPTLVVDVFPRGDSEATLGVEDFG